VEAATVPVLDRAAEILVAYAAIPWPTLRQFAPTGYVVDSRATLTWVKPASQRPASVEPNVPKRDYRRRHHLRADIRAQLPLTGGKWSLHHDSPINNRRLMLASSNSYLVRVNGVPGCLLGHSIFVGGARLTWLLNEQMPPFFGVKYRHVKLWIQPFDSKRRLLSCLVRFVSRLQLPIDRNMKWLGEGRFADCSDRGCSAIGNRRPCLPHSV
jgi:hypothetical protein